MWSCIKKPASGSAGWWVIGLGVNSLKLFESSLRRAIGVLGTGSNRIGRRCRSCKQRRSINLLVFDLFLRAASVL